LPITTPCFTTALAPTKVLSPTQTFPARTAPGAMCTASSKIHSCSIMQPVFNITFLPINANALTATFLLTKVPGPITALFEICAVL